MRSVTVRPAGAGFDGRGLVALDGLPGAEAALAGRKAAALVRARAAGLPVLPGIVIAPSAATVVTAVSLAAAVAALRRPLIARSSAADEDGADSSNAGRYLSVRDLTGDAELVEAVRAVTESGPGKPIAVLIQPQVDFALSGVLFGIDPVTGDRRTVVDITAGAPDRLVAGRESGDRLDLSGSGVFRRGNRRLGDRAVLAGIVGVRTRELGKALAALADRSAEVFGGPQDIEWGWTRAGVLWMLQARPVTRAAAPVRNNTPVLGTGPLAETFPEALWPLEVDTWLPPLRVGLEVALHTSGSGRPRAGQQVVQTVNGRLAADLGFFGRPPRRALFDLPGAFRRLRVAWRLGRLRAGLTGLTADIVREVDRLLVEVPDVYALGDAQLVGVVDRAGQALAVVHEYEALIGLVAAPATGEVSAAGVALSVLAASQAPARELVQDEPVLLALVPPSIGAPAWPRSPTAKRELDAPPPGAGPPHAEHDPRLGVLREALRLRARWLQELQAVAWRMLGERLAAAGRLPDPLAIRQLSRDELDALLADPGMTWPDRPDRAPDTTPLPVRFRLAEDGSVVATPMPDGSVAGAVRGVGASAGRALGVVVHDPDELDGSGGQVLVVEALEPNLAVHLPGLAALVSEVGSPLSHLAILAREHAVPCVVGVPAARGRLRPGRRVVVDGRVGTVDVEPLLGGER